MKYLFKNYILDDFKINHVLVLVTKCYILCYMERNQILMAYSSKVCDFPLKTLQNLFDFKLCFALLLEIVL